MWHGELLPIIWAHREKGIVGMVSEHGDGEVLSRITSHWGYRTVRGSSSHGGSAALSDLVQAAHDHVVMLTPDGPRGPACVMKPGAVVAAQRAGVPLLLVTVKVSRSKVLSRSWDSFQLPLPGATITILIDQPYLIPQDLDRKGVDAAIERAQVRLHELSAEVA